MHEDDLIFRFHSPAEVPSKKLDTTLGCTECIYEREEPTCSSETPCTKQIDVSVTSVYSFLWMNFRKSDWRTKIKTGNNPSYMLSRAAT